MDAIILARAQFAFTVSFHFLFPAFSIGLASYLAVLEALWLKTGKGVYANLFRYWLKIFAVVFAMGVVSGIVMSYQFGTNWSVFSDKAGPVIGPLMAYEVLTAFFLEAVFLGIMLFGFRRVSNRVHTLATFLVAFGTTLSAFWILALNSWMQTPAGFEMRDGVAFPVDWWAIVFNPSFPYRLVHMLLASGLTVAFLVAGLSALRFLAGDRAESMWKALRTGVFMGAALIPVQIFVGDMHGLNTLEHQPQKVAAMEANWETRGNVPLVLFAWPDEKARENRFEIAVPNGASLILRHSLDGVVPGLNDYVGEHPPVAPVFWGFRIMVGVGLAMLALSWATAWFLWRRGAMPRLLAYAYAPMAFSGWVATLAGWYTTEIGRQPWLVTGVLRTEEAVGPVAASNVGFTLAIYVVLYIVLMIVYLGVLTHLALKAAKDGDESPLPGVEDRALTQPMAGE